MSIEGLVVGLALLLVVGAWIGIPLLRRETDEVEVDPIQRQRERLELYYERTLRNIRDLDEDHSTGKINTEAYEPERENWVQRGIQALKALDELNENAPLAPETADAADIDNAIDSMIEEAVAQYRSKSEA